MRRAAVPAILIVLAVGLSVAQAHFCVLMPREVNVQPRSSTEVTYWVGHPFEHMLSNAARPAQCFAVSSEGDRQDLLPALQERSLKAQEDKSFSTWRTVVKTLQRGDYTLVAISQPAIDDGVVHQAFVKTVLHAKVQKGWDRVLNLPAELVPLTRPYGLLPGTIFQVQVLKEGKPAAGVMVEFEKYNEQPVPADKVPADEYVTHVVKTDPNGIATTNLPEAGWWGILAALDGGTVEAEGKRMSSVRNATYWVRVDAAPQQD